MQKSLGIVFWEARWVVVSEEEVAAPGPGEVLCRAQKSLVSRGTETFCLKGEYEVGTYWEDYIQYPLHPGNSMAARVEAVGEGVFAFRPGDRVTAANPHSQWFVADQKDLFPIPDEISDEEATWATLARTTQLAVRRASLQLGETVGVVGLGVLGQLVTQYLTIAGARRIIGIDTSQKRCELALASGATDVVLSPVAQARDEVATVTNGAMLDAVFDITGEAAVLAPATELLRKHGRLVLLGDSPTPSLQHLGPRVVGDSLSILGISGLSYPEHATPLNPWTAEAMTATFFDFLLQKRMDVLPLIDRSVSPADAPKIYEGLLSGDEAIGIIFDWTTLPD